MPVVILRNGLRHFSHIWYVDRLELKFNMTVAARSSLERQVVSSRSRHHDGLRRDVAWGRDETAAHFGIKLSQTCTIFEFAYFRYYFVDCSNQPNFAPHSIFACVPNTRTTNPRWRTVAIFSNNSTDSREYRQDTTFTY